MLKNEVRGAVMAIYSDELLRSIKERVAVFAGIKLRGFSLGWHRP